MLVCISLSFYDGDRCSYTLPQNMYKYARTPKQKNPGYTAGMGMHVALYICAIADMCYCSTVAREVFQLSPYFWTYEKALKNGQPIDSHRIQI